jgi:hypothetical protein
MFESYLAFESALIRPNGLIVSGFYTVWPVFISIVASRATFGTRDFVIYNMAPVWRASNFVCFLIHVVSLFSCFCRPYHLPPVVCWFSS